MINKPSRCTLQDNERWLLWVGRHDSIRLLEGWISGSEMQGVTGLMSSLPTSDRGSVQIWSPSPTVHFFRFTVRPRTNGPSLRHLIRIVPHPSTRGLVHAIRSTDLNPNEEINKSKDSVCVTPFRLHESSPLELWWLLIHSFSFAPLDIGFIWSSSRIPCRSTQPWTEPLDPSYPVLSDSGSPLPR